MRVKSRQQTAWIHRDEGHRPTAVPQKELLRLPDDRSGKHSRVRRRHAKDDGLGSTGL